MNPSPRDSQDARHPLDAVIWQALTTAHRDLAEGDDLARLYPAPVAPFAAVRNFKPASYRSLLSLLPTGDRLALFTTEPVDPPAAFAVGHRDMVDQMVLDDRASLAGGRPVVTLQAGDVPEMAALVEMTHPGPFGPRTIELGRYVGIRRNDRLVAMAGERMRLDGYAEISAVCVHPDCRGGALAADVVAALARLMRERRDTPFLHVFATNSAAAALYRKLGFVRRRPMHLAVLVRG